MPGWGAVADEPGWPDREPAGGRRRILAGAAGGWDQLWRGRAADARVAGAAALCEPVRLREVQELHQRGAMPAPPGDADGPRRDRAHSRRSQPRRSDPRGRTGQPLTVIARSKATKQSIYAPAWLEDRKSTRLNSSH